MAILPQRLRHAPERRRHGHGPARRRGHDGHLPVLHLHAALRGLYEGRGAAAPRVLRGLRHAHHLHHAGQVPRGDGAGAHDQRHHVAAQAAAADGLAPAQRGQRRPRGGAHCRPEVRRPAARGAGRAHPLRRRGQGRRVLRGRVGHHGRAHAPAQEARRHRLRLHREPARDAAGGRVRGGLEEPHVPDRPARVGGADVQGARPGVCRSRRRCLRAGGAHHRPHHLPHLAHLGLHRRHPRGVDGRRPR
mmetsp:Transcript_1433/g.3719  ORF Transcript_1433/g.3719 Transcript_1433/m.3719 type:complete len:247 (+) Transcript_1433:1091-1831(+)